MDLLNRIVKTACTAYGKIGTDWVRMTAAYVDGVAVFVKADGSNTIIDTLPVQFRTSGDIANVVSLLGHRVNLASVPAVGLPDHAWKPRYTLEGIVEHMGADATLVARLQATYSEAEAIAA